MNKIYSCKYTKNGTCVCSNKHCFGTKKDTSECSIFINEGPKKCLKYDYMDSAQIIKNFIIVSRKEDCDFWKNPQKYDIGNNVSIVLGVIDNQIGIAIMVNDEFVDLSFGCRTNCVIIKCTYSDLKEILPQILAENIIYTGKRL